MSLFGRWWRSRDERDVELDAEIASHLEMDMRARVARGESPADARRHAEEDFGDLVTVREVTSDMWSGEWAHRALQDVRHAARSLTRVPGFALVAVLTLALGIGANTAIFSVINGVILRPLPYPKPKQLVFITSQFPSLGFPQFWIDAAEFLELRERSRSFNAIGAYTASAANVGADESPQRVTSANITVGFFDALGVHPEQGRVFNADELLPNGPAVVVLSDELWRSAFGSRAIIGKQIQVNGVARTVTGIMPPGFDVHDQGVKLWLPLPLDPAQRKQYRGGHFLYAIGRLRDGVSLAQARTELEGMLVQWVALDGGTPGAKCCGAGFVHAPDPKFHRLQYADLQEDMIGSIGRALWILQAAVVVVLLIACANLANLLLMRAESRQRELALRAALGAGRGRLIQYFMAESLVIALAGAAVGILLAYAGVRGLVAAGAASIPRAQGIVIDARVLAFTLSLAVGCGVVFGLAPMLHLGVNALGIALREAGSRTTAIGARSRVRRGLVIAEMALAVMLVIGAGLLLRSFWNVMRVDAGFDRANLSTFGIALPGRVYSDSVRRVAFFNDLIQQLDAVPGVERAAAMTGLPPKRQVNANDTFFEGFVPQKDGPQNNIDYDQYVTHDYFETMRIPIVAGRAFDASDGAMSPPVLLINETTARLYYPHQNPIGRRIKPNGDSLWFTVIGVAKDVKQGGLDSKTGTELYILNDQTPRTEGFSPVNMNIVVRSRLDPATLAPTIHRIVNRLDATLPVIQYRSMDDVFSESEARPHFLAELLGVFATVALLLSAIGTYGVLAYSVAERRREIGIRLALGASETGVLRMVLRQGLGLATVGLLIGLVGAALLTRLASTLLFGVKPVDLPTYAAVAVFMLLVAVLASIVPARRATTVDPLVALRTD
jgi:putative ABC transport system permease protein